MAESEHLVNSFNNMKTCPSRSLNGSSLGNEDSKKFEPRNKKVLVIDLCNPLSLGGAAIAIVLTDMLNSLDDVTADFMSSRNRDQKIYRENYNINNKFVSHFWYKEKYSTANTLLSSLFPASKLFLKCSLAKLFRKINLNFKTPFDEYDLILDLNSDSINEHYGMVFPLFTLFNLFLASSSGKPVVVCPCTIGVFKNKVVRFFAKFVLDGLDVIMVREDLSRSNLAKLGVTKPEMYTIPDLAFLFKPSPPVEIKKTFSNILNENETLIAVAPSQEINRYAFAKQITDSNERYQKYIELMSEVVDLVIEKTGSSVVLIPHSLDEKNTERYLALDDRIACENIYKNVKNKQKTFFVEDENRADIVKGLIGHCDMLISSRMHPAIAATSQGIPTVVLTYGEKFEGIIGRWMGQLDYLVDISNEYSQVLSDLDDRINAAWNHKTSISKELKERITGVQSLSMKTIDLIKQTLSSTKKDVS